MVSIHSAYPVKSLLFLLLLPACSFGQLLNDSETTALVTKLAASRAGRMVQADFIETKTLPMWKDPVVESGTIAFEPPDHFFRKTDNLIISDGRTLWMYYPEFHQVEKYPLAGHGPGQLFAALGQAFRFENLDTLFRISATRLEDGFRLDLTPRSGPMRRMLRSLILDLDSSLRLRSSTMVGKDGDRIETKYSNEKLLSPGSIDFSFKPPASATVVAPLGG
ncbi:MAG: outer membrane lipoprotein carrier protein LolA [Verrucomicrobiaceae bacterium]|nr:MAG: outer membrane lipoprotein carrier protein LolA [Verrucomicrobiaceae bacterium]